MLMRCQTFISALSTYCRQRVNGQSEKEKVEDKRDVEQQQQSFGAAEGGARLPHRIAAGMRAPCSQSWWSLRLSICRGFVRQRPGQRRGSGEGGAAVSAETAEGGGVTLYVRERKKSRTGALARVSVSMMSPKFKLWQQAGLVVMTSRWLERERATQTRECGQSKY